MQAVTCMYRFSHATSRNNHHTFLLEKGCERLEVLLQLLLVQDMHLLPHLNAPPTEIGNHEEDSLQDVLAKSWGIEAF